MPQIKHSGCELFAPVDISTDHRADGSAILKNNLVLPHSEKTMLQILRHWATVSPDIDFLRQRIGDEWVSISYGAMWHKTGIIGERLLAAGCSSERPLMILADNGIGHAEMAMAAMRVGVPAVPVSTAYATISSKFDRLRHVTETASPAVLYVDRSKFAGAAAALEDMVDTITGDEIGAVSEYIPSASFITAEQSVTPDTIAKLIFTSGSTGRPKAVINTHRMLWANQAALSAIWPCLDRRPPVLVDWLPWNHTFGGNFVFNLALYRGGTLHIDEGRPVPGAIDKTLRNVTEVGPTAYFNVPAGYAAMLPGLEADLGRAKRFFANLDFLFCAAAALPQTTRDRLNALAQSAAGRTVPIIGGWGSTETAPCSTAVYFENTNAANIGVPLPGTLIKLVPNQGKRELRIKGPNVMPGYWRAPEATAAAFDEEGFYIIGDAGRLIDDDKPERGIAFDGRTAENFKLESGTWVNVGTLRLALIEAAQPLIQDAVVTGHNLNEIGVLLFPNLAACCALAEQELDAKNLVSNPIICDAVREKINEHNRSNRGSSTTISRFLILAEPPSIDAGEITDKGYINQRSVLQCRASAVESLYENEQHKVQMHAPQ
jgi:feruloyl-CoA synthase